MQASSSVPSTQLPGHRNTLVAGIPATHSSTRCRAPPWCCWPSGSQARQGVITHRLSASFQAKVLPIQLQQVTSAVTHGAPPYTAAWAVLAVGIAAWAAADPIRTNVGRTRTPAWTASRLDGLRSTVQLLSQVLLWCIIPCQSFISAIQPHLLLASSTAANHAASWLLAVVWGAVATSAGGLLGIAAGICLTWTWSQWLAFRHTKQHQSSSTQAAVVEPNTDVPAAKDSEILPKVFHSSSSVRQSNADTTPKTSKETGMVPRQKAGLPMVLAKGRDWVSKRWSPLWVHHTNKPLWKAPVDSDAAIASAVASALGVPQAAQALIAPPPRPPKGIRLLLVAVGTAAATACALSMVPVIPTNVSSVLQRFAATSSIQLSAQPYDVFASGTLTGAAVTMWAIVLPWFEQCLCKLAIGQSQSNTDEKANQPSAPLAGLTGLRPGGISSEDLPQGRVWVRVAGNQELLLTPRELAELVPFNTPLPASLRVSTTNGGPQPAAATYTSPGSPLSSQDGEEVLEAEVREYSPPASAVKQGSPEASEVADKLAGGSRSALETIQSAAGDLISNPPLIALLLGIVLRCIISFCISASGADSMLQLDGTPSWVTKSIEALAGGAEHDHLLDTSNVILPGASEASSNLPGPWDWRALKSLYHVLLQLAAWSSGIAPTLIVLCVAAAAAVGSVASTSRSKHASALALQDMEGASAPIVERVETAKDTVPGSWKHRARQAMQAFKRVIIPGSLQEFLMVFWASVFAFAVFPTAAAVLLEMSAGQTLSLQILPQVLEQVLNITAGFSQPVLAAAALLQISANQVCSDLISDSQANDDDEQYAAAILQQAAATSCTVLRVALLGSLLRSSLPAIASLFA